MEENLSYKSASGIVEKLNEAGIESGDTLQARHNGHSYKLVLGPGSRLPGNVESQQLRIEVKQTEPIGKHEPEEIYQITLGVGKTGQYIESERRRRGNGTTEKLGHVREGDIPHLLEIIKLAVDERNSRTMANYINHYR